MSAFPTGRRAHASGTRPPLPGPDDRSARTRRPHGAADEITAEYVEMTGRRGPGRPAQPRRRGLLRPHRHRSSRGAAERFYLGRRHIEDDDHDPVVVDWRAPVAAPFYRATGRRPPFGVFLRRRFTLDEGEITAYLDEHLDDPDAADVASGIPDPVLAEIGAERTGAMREIVATIQAEQDLVDPRPDRPGPRRPGRPRHRQDGRRPAPRRLPDVRAPPSPGARRRARRRAEPGVPRLHRQRAAVARGAQRAAVHRRRPVRAQGRDHRRRRPRHGGAQGFGDGCSTSWPRRRCRRSTASDDVVVPIGVRRLGFTRRRDRRVARARGRCRDPGQPAASAPAGDRRAGVAAPHRPATMLGRTPLR